MAKGKASFLLVILLLVTAFLPTAVSAETTDESWISSDEVSFSVESDSIGDAVGVISIFELQKLIERCIKERKYDPRGDLNLDGSVNSTDLTVLKRYVLGMIPWIPMDPGGPRVD